ncbi:MAG: hypothetical protein K6G15_06375 [Desulfovibrio sp.]|nr:hypothetical protein [Desulfovibrio sp.]
MPLIINGNEIVFKHAGICYKLSDHPNESCLYLLRSQKIAFTLHNAFSLEEIRKALPYGGVLHFLSGRDIDENDFCRILDYTIENKHCNCDFVYVEKLCLRESRGNEPKSR